MKVKDLLPIIKGEFEITTKRNGIFISLCSHPADLTEAIKESEVISIHGGVWDYNSYCVSIDVEYNKKLVVDEEIEKYPDTVWVMITEDDVRPMLYYFKEDAKRAFGEFIRKKYEYETEITKMSNDEIWDGMLTEDWFDGDYVFQQSIIK